MGPVRMLWEYIRGRLEKWWCLNLHCSSSRRKGRIRFDSGVFLQSPNLPLSPMLIAFSDWILRGQKISWTWAVSWYYGRCGVPFVQLVEGDDAVLQFKSEHVDLRKGVNDVIRFPSSKCKPCHSNWLCGDCNVQPPSIQSPTVVSKYPQLLHPWLERVSAQIFSGHLSGTWQHELTERHSSFGTFVCWYRIQRHSSDSTMLIN